MKFEVILNNWGNYKKGDVLNMHKSTGEACSKALKPYKDSKRNKTK